LVIGLCCAIPQSFDSSRAAGPSRAQLVRQLRQIDALAAGHFFVGSAMVKARM
jgi:hypothetical protein